MKLVSQVVVLLVVMLFFSTLQGMVLAAKPVDEAQQAAQAWLVLVDAGKYQESWEEAAAILKQKMSAEKWLQEFGKPHKELGKVLSRKGKSSELTTNVKDIPEGEYVVVQYDTAFANKPQATETVIVMREKDGRWRVAGYWIKDPETPPAGGKAR